MTYPLFIFFSIVFGSFAAWNAYIAIFVFGRRKEYGEASNKMTSCITNILFLICLGLGMRITELQQQIDQFPADKLWVWAKVRDLEPGWWCNTPPEFEGTNGDGNPICVELRWGK